MIDGAPEIVLDTVDFHKDLIQVPLPLCVLSHVGGTLRSDLASEDRAEPIDPEPHALMADIDPAFMKEVFDIAKRQREADIHHHCELDDFGRRFEIAKRIFAYPKRLG